MAGSAESIGRIHATGASRPEAEDLAPEPTEIEAESGPTSELRSLNSQPGTGYHSSDEHLHDELRRIDCYVRAQTTRWRAMIGDHKPVCHWGMVHVSHEEVEAYLNAQFVPPGDLPPSMDAMLKRFWQQAERQAEAIAARRKATSADVRLHLERLKDLFDLTELQRNILLVCLLPEVDERYRRLYGYLMDDASRARPTVELVLQILYPLSSRSAAGRAAFEASSPLIVHHLLASGPEVQGEESMAMRSLRLDDRIAGYLLGDPAPDGRLQGILVADKRQPDWEQIYLEADRLARLKMLADWWRERSNEPQAGLTLFLHGGYGSGRRKAALAICAKAGSQLLAVDLAEALRAPLPFELVVDLCLREARLQEAALYWSHAEALLDGDAAQHRWDYLVSACEAFPGLTFLASETVWDPAGRFRSDQHPFTRLGFPVPGFKLRQTLWAAYLPEQHEFAEPYPDRAALIERLANSFQLTEGQIEDSLVTARELATQRNPLDPRLRADDLHEACRRQSSRRLITFARRIELRTDWTPVDDDDFDRLILPEANRRQLVEMWQRIRYRSQVYAGLGFERQLTLGKGLIALFTGSSGTGKTMAAELLARKGGVDLYKVDLSAVVSKYVGETEKNLSRVFAEAEDSNAIIFFDEADALFGKRGEVKEARDRWANIEVNYLLQRVEEYAGVVILATNLRQNIDEAFLRRVHVVVEFPFPEADARHQIWLGMFPAGVNHPGETEIGVLAERFRLAGGSIRNIVVDAAFRALAEAHQRHQPAEISLRHLVLGTAREYQKLGKPLTKGEFGEDFYKWVKESILIESRGRD
jgi:hypothetical protein